MISPAPEWVRMPEIQYRGYLPAVSRCVYPKVLKPGKPWLLERGWGQVREGSCRTGELDTLCSGLPHSTVTPWPLLAGTDYPVCQASASVASLHRSGIKKSRLKIS